MVGVGTWSLLTKVPQGKNHNQKKSTVSDREYDSLSIGHRRVFLIAVFFSW
jgi:hypothetical protein